MASRRLPSSDWRDRYRTVERSTLNAAHARRWLARWTFIRCATACAWHRVSPLLRVNIPKHRVVENLFGHHLRQIRVFGLQRPQRFCIGDLHAALFASPFVERRAADPVFEAQLTGRQARLALLQNAIKCFAEMASLHRPSPQLENRLTTNRGLFRGEGQSGAEASATLTLAKRQPF